MTDQNGHSDWDLPDPAAGGAQYGPYARPRWWSDPSAPVEGAPHQQVPGQPPQYPPSHPTQWQQPTGYGYGGQPTSGQGEGRGGLSGAAIAATVLGFLGIVVAAVPLGIVALRRVRRYQQTGTGLAVTGIALSAAWVVGFAIIGGVQFLGVDRTRDVAVSDLAKGDCIDSIDKAGVKALSPSSTVTVVECDSGHVAQVYGTPSIGGTYPGDVALDLLATARCAQAERENLDDSVLQVLTYTRAPFTAETAGEWSKYDGAVCFVIFPEPRAESVVS